MKATGKLPVVLRNRDFAKLLFSNAAGRLADSLDAITFSWLMYLITGNAVMIALVFAANYAPTILLQPFTGVLADRFSKKRIVFLCDLGRTLLAFLTGALFFAGQLAAWMLFPLTLAISTLEAFRMPAGAAMIPELLPQTQYQQGNGLNMTLQKILEAVGTAVAGILIAAGGCSLALAIDGLFFLVSSFLVFSISVPMLSHPEENEPSDRPLSFRAGLRHLRSNQNIAFFIFAAAIFNFLSVPYSAFQSIYFGDTLAFSADALSLCGALLLAGASLGAFLAPLLNRRVSGRGCVRLSLALHIPFYFALFFLGSVVNAPTRLALIALLYLALGLSTGVFSVVAGSALMESVESGYLGRISGISNAIGMSMVPLCSLVCSSLATRFTVPEIFALFALFGILPLLIACFSFRQSKKTAQADA